MNFCFKKKVYLSIFLFFLSVLKAQATETWCIKNLKNPPCGGAAGQCTINRNGVLGGFVANSAHVLTEIKNGKKYIIPHIGQFSQICDTATVLENAQILEKAVIFGSAQVSGNARVKGNARIGGNAQVSGHALVSEHALIQGDATISGFSRILGSTVVSGSAQISDQAEILGMAKIEGHSKVASKARISGNAHIYDNSVISGNARVLGYAQVNGNSVISMNAIVKGQAIISGNSFIFGNARVSGQALIKDEAQICDSANVTEYASVSGNAQVYGNAMICGQAILTADDRVGGNSRMSSISLNLMSQDLFKRINDRRNVAQKRIQSNFITPVSGVEELVIWSKEAHDRSRHRIQVLQDLNGNDSFQQDESIMNRSITQGYLKSIDHLDLRYPWAVPRAELSLREVYRMVENYNAKARGESGLFKKEFALRYLDRVATFHESDLDFGFVFAQEDTSLFCEDPLQSGLVNIEVLSLAWEAIQDKNLFKTQIDIEDRQWGLIEALAHIQRAHNDENGWVDFLDSTETDQPSCPAGTFKRLIEHLDGLHPDVRLNPEAEIKKGMGISNRQVCNEVMIQHRVLFASLSPENQKAIRENYEDRGEPYRSYLQLLRSKVVAAAPLVSSSQIDQNLTDILMYTLLEI